VVSGYDKRPPEDQYQPDFGRGGRFAIIALVIAVVLVNLALLFA
jgi:hypothetical protein